MWQNIKGKVKQFKQGKYDDLRFSALFSSNSDLFRPTVMEAKGQVYREIQPLVDNKHGGT